MWESTGEWGNDANVRWRIRQTWGVFVRRYRFCLLDQRDQIVFADVFVAADDDAAKAFLSRHLLSFSQADRFQLWESNRLVFSGAVAALMADSPTNAEAEDVEPNEPTLDRLALRSERLRAAYAYWQGKRNGRLMPARADIDPIDIPALLPYVVLIDVLSEPLDFRYRLIGTAARSISRRDYTGLRFSELPGKGQDSELWRGCEEVVRSRSPHSHSPPYVGADAFVRNCENVILPLSDDGDSVTMILKVISFDYALSAPV